MNDPDLKAVLSGMAEEERLAGDHLTADELAAYRSGELADGDREGAEEHLAACPECAGLLLDLASFEEPAPPASEIEVARVWRGVRQRAAAAEARPAVRSPRWLQALAAALLVATTALGAWVATLERRLGEAGRPQINTPVQDLRAPLSRGTSGPAPVVVDLDLDPGTRLYTLVLVPASRQGYPDYEVTLERSGGSEVWRSRGLRKNRYGTFSLTLSRDIAGSGQYLIRLFGIGESGRAPLGDYKIRVE